MKRLLAIICTAVMLTACAGIQTAAAPTEQVVIEKRFLADGTPLLNLCECMTLLNGNTMCAVAEAVHPLDGSILQWVIEKDATCGRILKSACAMIGIDQTNGAYLFMGFLDDEVCYDMLENSAEVFKFKADDIYKECMSL